GTYNVTVSDGNGNTETASATVGETGGILSITTSVTNATQGNCDGSATATASGGNPPYTYQWDGNTGDQTTQTAVALCPGTYNVIVTDGNGNTGTASATVGLISGINGLQVAGYRLQVYPNPSRGMFTVETEEGRLMKDDGKWNIRIFNIFGQEVYKSTITNPQSSIDMSSHQAGIYNLQVITDKGIINKKIIIE
ncbi:MAG: T9SS type A sorting domain-containing protein, partial [Bacteroidota bacterium]